MTQIKNDILAEADRIINGERQEQYGKPEDSFVLIAEYWNRYLQILLKSLMEEYEDDFTFGKAREYEFYTCFGVESKDVAMLMCLLKIARTQGGQEKKDNYVDICGYAALAADL